MQLHAVKSIGINGVRVQRRKRSWLVTKSNCLPKIAGTKSKHYKDKYNLKTALIKNRKPSCLQKTATVNKTTASQA